MLTANHISIPLGIITGLLASFVQSLGLTIQRKSHVLNQSMPEHRQRVEHRRPLWLLGFVIFISSNIIGSFVQIASLPVVILAPLGAVSLLWNAFFARLLLGDVFSPWMILGTILIAGGAILIAFFGIVPEQTRSLEDLLELFRRPTFIVYFSILGFAVFVCLAVTHLTEFSLSRRLEKTFPPDSSSSDFSPASSNINLPTHSANMTMGLTDTLNDSLLPDERTPLIDHKLPNPPANGQQITDPTLHSINHTRLLLAVSYASFSGIISGMCLLFAKSGVELLLLTLGGNNQFWRWEAWVLVLGLIAFALLQLWYLHKALTLADPTLVCPSAFCFYNLSSIMNGLVYFDQFSLIPPLHLGLVILGIVVLLGGVWVVSIQSGGGGVDIGTWNEETVELTGEDVALYSEPEGTEEQDRPSEAVAMTRQPETGQAKLHFGPVPLDRETRSESSLPTTGSGPTEGQTNPPPSSMISSAKRQRAETQLYPSPRTPSHHSKHRPTVDLHRSSSSSHQLHGRTVSHPHPPYSHAALSPPPLGTVSTLGPGFQIGLSPLSPGFTITPLERRRRPGPSLADVASEVIQERRRTVSEGEATRRMRDDSRVDDEEAERGVGNADIPEPVLSRVQHVSGHARNGRKRWRWLRNVFTNKD
ncbi:hypothetical protein GALMADRAFT_233518 [Galerina marginata CBS 339.88]|uniref:Uncharacterized protein n=1 Tax=Galerina marginata (strain CBS 339.88) TaxID=685588 RepID=A0A067TPB4_GALM3|nr:hypothetical protein GALMADRAFT_233518 [Galerina marginata CBS 339.88]